MSASCSDIHFDRLRPSRDSLLETSGEVRGARSSQYLMGYGVNARPYFTIYDTSPFTWSVEMTRLIPTPVSYPGLLPGYRIKDPAFITRRNHLDNRLSFQCALGESIELPSVTCLEC